MVLRRRDDEGAWCSFFLPQHPDLVGGTLWPDDLWPQRFVGSEDAWITQTYLRLRRAGYPVAAFGADRAPCGSVVVAHPDHLPLLFGLDGVDQCYVAVTLADKTHGHRGADAVITQNVSDASVSSRFVPHWPQPGLLPRDKHRIGVRVAAFKGRAETLHPDLRSPLWSDELAGLGLAWHVDDDDGGQTARSRDDPSAWSDYRETDLAVALRPPGRDPRKSKPASKLVNAWLAGVPAILGAEPQYRELRCCELDYLEVRNPLEALEAVRRLQEDEDLYRRMVHHGVQRSEAFRPEVITAAWVQAIVVMRARARRERSVGSLPRRCKTLAYRRYLRRSSGGDLG